MPLNICDDVLNLIGEYANMRIETKKYKSKKYNNKMKITKILYECCNCERMMPYYRINIENTVDDNIYVECKNYGQCAKIWIDKFSTEYIFKI